MADTFAEALAAAIEKRANDSPLPRMPRRPDTNHPFQAERNRAPRQRTYRDPTGNEAVGNVKKEKS